MERSGIYRIVDAAVERRNADDESSVVDAGMIMENEPPPRLPWWIDSGDFSEGLPRAAKLLIVERDDRDERKENAVPGMFWELGEVTGTQCFGTSVRGFDRRMPSRTLLSDQRSIRHDDHVHDVVGDRYATEMDRDTFDRAHTDHSPRLQTNKAGRRRSDERTSRSAPIKPGTAKRETTQHRLPGSKNSLLLVPSCCDHAGMPVELLESRDPQATRAILEGLPEWFGIPEAITGYVQNTESREFRSLVARDGDRTVGVTLIARHFPESAEIHLIAVARGHRGQGVGRSLIERAIRDLSADGCQMLSVHTVGPSFDDPAYATTRDFYRSVGFVPLEEHRDLDWPGPTLILVQPLTRAPL